MRHCGLLSSAPGGYGPPCLENLAPALHHFSWERIVSQVEEVWLRNRLPNDLKMEAHRWLISGSSGLEIELESAVAVVQLFRFRRALIGRSE
ncbi:hypothetical protein CEXT_784341 [Caerostris extrusa]|uniref:Uncharacterized protein n=1 Tax=Caerostris extrusa TaxID=172846 RepID=A0AAV4R576_CAEEX|nr:hypothetical protein CEXT_784341 [Caerostris extrusa]